MIRRKCTQLGGELGTAAGGQLISVQFGTETGRLRGSKNSRGLGDAERRVLHKDITAGRELLPGNLGNQPGDEKLHVLGPPVSELGRNHVSAQKGRDQTHWLLRCESAIHPKELELVLLIQSVAALALDRRDSQGEHCDKKSARAGHQLVFGGRPGLADSGENSPTGPSDFEVTLALSAGDELVRSPAGKGQMGVAIDQAGDDQAAAGIESLCRAVLDWKLA